MPTIEQYTSAIRKAEAAGDMEAAEYLHGERNKVAMSSARAEQAGREDARFSKRGLGDRLQENLAAGTGQLTQGVRQLAGMFGRGKGVSDEEIDQTRAYDKMIARNTTGGGATQVVGEILPTMLIPGGIATKGMTMLPKATALGSAMLGGAAEGALTGALSPVRSDESRLANMGYGAAAGGVLPLAIKAVSKVPAMAVGAYDNVGAAANALTRGAVGGKSVDRLSDKAAGKVFERNGITANMLDVQQYTPSLLMKDAPLTASMYSKSEPIARLERASRATTNNFWNGIDERLGQARWDALDNGLSTTDDVTKLLGRADKVGAAAPYSKVDPANFDAMVQQFAGGIQAAKQTPAYVSRRPVREAIDYIEGVMNDAGTITPELVHEMRMNISKGLPNRPGVGDSAVRATKGDPKTLDLVKQIDDVMDQSSGGQWSRWKDSYSSAMRKAESAKAESNIRNVFVDEATGVVRNPLSSGAPNVTQTQLANAVRRFGQGPMKKAVPESALTSGGDDAVRAVLDNIEAQNILQRVKTSGTGLGGSNTAMDGAAIIGSSLTGFLPGAAAAGIKLGRDVAVNPAMQQKVAELLADPARMAAFLRNFDAVNAKRGLVPYVPGLGAGAAAALPLSE